MRSVCFPPASPALRISLLVILLTLLLAILCATSTSAALRGVPVPYATIQSAILASAAGDTVLVQPGSYHEAIDFLGREILVTSRFALTGDTADIAVTELRPADLIYESIVRFVTGETRAARLCGFTVTGGVYFQGAGIRCVNASPTLDHLWIIGNSAAGDGGGIYATGGSPQVRFCRVARNSATGDGGGICALLGFIEILDSEILDNRCSYRGAGAFCENSTMIISRNRFAGNRVEGAGAYNGGGFTSRNCDPLIIENTIVQNDGAGYGGGIFY